MSDLSNVSCVSETSEQRPKRVIKPPKSDLNSPRLISLVSKLPVLWNFNLPDYHNTNLRSEAWESVAKQFHGVSAADCALLWTTIRNGLRQNETRHEKATRSGSEGKRLKPYVYAERLSFLKFLKKDVVECQQGNLDEGEGSFLGQLPQTSSPLKDIQNTLQPITLFRSTSTVLSDVIHDKSTVVGDSSYKENCAPQLQKAKSAKPRQMKRKGRIDSMLPKIDEEDLDETVNNQVTENERKRKDSEDDTENVDVPSPKVAKKMKRQQQLIARREAQCAEIQKRVKAANATKAADKQQTPPPQRGPTEDELLQKVLMTEDDTFTHFAMSLVQPLRSLPEDMSMKLRVQIMTNVFDAIRKAKEVLDEPVADDKGSELSTQEAVVEQALASNDDHILLSVDKTNVMVLDAKSLLPNMWVNDMVINGYLRMIVKRSEETLGSLMVMNFSTDFWTCISDRGLDSVQKWMKNIDLFLYDLILVPLFLNNNHWALAVIHLKDQAIRFYDSMRGRNVGCLNMLTEFMESRNSGLIDFSEWDRAHMTDIPKQMNGNDCGVFLMVFAEHISRGASVSTLQHDMTYYRKRILYEIVSGRMLPS